MEILDTSAPSQKPAPLFWNTVWRYGGFCGLGLVVLSLIMYLVDFNMMSLGGMAFHFLVAAAVMVSIAAAGIKFQRNTLDGGFINFGRAFVIGALITVVAVVISSLWNYVFINFIDPDYIVGLKEKFTETWGDRMPEDKLDETLAQFDNAGNIGQLAKQALWSMIIGGGLVGLIAGGIMKRERPIV